MNSRLLEMTRAGLRAEASRGLRALAPEELRQAASESFDEGRLMWVVAGDRARVGRELREAGAENFALFGPG